MIELIKHGEMSAAQAGKLKRKRAADAAGRAGDQDALVGEEWAQTRNVEDNLGTPKGKSTHVAPIPTNYPLRIAG
jgi:hypothetical protein